MSDDPSLSKAYDLKTPVDSVRLYRDWADTYDSGFVVDHGYALHLRVAEAFAQAEGTGPVLDIGAGTGICGADLAARGIGPVDATDISPEMLLKAADKGCYRQTIEGDILAGLPIQPDTYAGAVSSGTFTHGHVGPEPLDEIMRILKPGGLLACTVHNDLWQSRGFEDAFSRLVDSGQVETLYLEEGLYYEDKPPEGRFCVYRKI